MRTPASAIPLRKKLLAVCGTLSKEWHEPRKALAPIARIGLMKRKCRKRWTLFCPFQAPTWQTHCVIEAADEHRLPGHPRLVLVRERRGGHRRGRPQRGWLPGPCGTPG